MYIHLPLLCPFISAGESAGGETMRLPSPSSSGFLSCRSAAAAFEPTFAAAQNI